MLNFTTYAGLERIRSLRGVITELHIEELNELISNINGNKTDIRYELIITNKINEESIGENKGKLLDNGSIEIYYNEATHQITLASTDRLGLSLLNVYQMSGGMYASEAYQPTINCLIDKLTLIDIDLYDISELISESFEAIKKILVNIKELKLIDCQIGYTEGLAMRSYNLEKGPNFEKLSLIDCTLALAEIRCNSWGNLKILDIERLKAPNLKNIDGLFIATNIEEIKLYRCEFPQVQSTKNLFLNSNKLKKVDIIKSFWQSPLNNTSSMFENCRALEEVSGLCTMNMHMIETTENMFNNCENLKSIVFKDTAFNALNSAVAMFSGCRSLKYLSLEGLDWAEELVNVQNMFKGIPEDCEIVLKHPIKAVSLYEDFDNSMEQARMAVAIEKYYRNNYELLDELKENTFNAFEKSVLINSRTLYTMILHVNITIGNELCTGDTQINLVKSDGNIENLKKTVLKAKMLNDIVIMRPNCLITVNPTGDVMNIISDEFIQAGTCAYNIVYI